MSHHLDCGYTVRRVPGPHFVNGTPVRSFRDDIDREIIITDDGNPDELVDRTAEAVMEAVAMSQKVQGAPDGIEALTEKMPKCPVIPSSQDPRLPFSPPSGA